MLNTILNDLPDTAALEAQKTGRSLSLCRPNSDFSQAVSNCQTRIDLSGNVNTTEATTLPFQQYLDFCQNVSGANETLTDQVVSYQSAVSSYSAVSASLATVAASLSLTTSRSADGTTSMYSNNQPERAIGD